MDVYLQFYHVTPEVESLLTKILHRFLEQYDILYIKDILLTVLRELVNNAVKANMKRLYFFEKKLDINDRESYKLGMKKFKEEAYEKRLVDFDGLATAKLVVRASFIFRNGNFIIHVINNSPILDVELQKINARIKQANTYNNIYEAFDDALDDSEGAGLGLIVATMLFKNSGFPANPVKIMRREKLTVATVTIPVDHILKERQTLVAGEITNEIESLPSFPAHIKEIQRLCFNPETKIKEISDRIKRDPGLTTNILKIANSAGYMTINRVETIEEAVLKIGMKGINTLIVASGVQKIMESRYKKFEAMWKHSHRAAFYSQRIAIQYKKVRLVEFVYLAALLSEIGRLVILSIKPEISEKIKGLVGIKGIGDSGVLEEMSLGISHSTLGSMILKKWGFNEALVNTIEYHKRPHLAPEQYRDLIYIVYLSTVLLDIEMNRIKYEVLDEDVLEYFQIARREEFMALHNMLKQAYEVQSQEIH